MPDLTEACGKIFAAYETICRDLASLANDFAAEIGADTWTPKEYSYSPNKLIPKSAHAWYWDRREVKNEKLVPIEFAAVLVVFQGARPRKKVGPVGRPELWFMLGAVGGSTLPAATMNEQVVAQFLEPRPGTFTPPLHLDPPTTKYVYEDTNEKWDVNLLGLEIGQLTGGLATESDHATARRMKPP
jgi:hypothetical protein